MQRMRSRSHNLVQSISFGTLLFFALLGLMSAKSYAQENSNTGQLLAGEVIMAKGAVSATLSGEGSRRLQRRDEVYVGDTITVSAGGSVQFRMVDSAMIALRENTTFAVIDYSFEQAATEDVSTLELVKGAFRTITGNIAKDRYRLEVTDYATIGIRGTEFEVVIADDGSLYTGVYDGGTTVSNAAGEINLGVGSEFDFGSVADGNSVPVGLEVEPEGVGDIEIQREEDLSDDVASNQQQDESPDGDSDDDSGDSSASNAGDDEEPNAVAASTEEVENQSEDGDPQSLASADQAADQEDSRDQNDATDTNRGGSEPTGSIVASEEDDASPGLAVSADTLRAEDIPATNEESNSPELSTDLVSGDSGLLASTRDEPEQDVSSNLAASDQSAAVAGPAANQESSRVVATTQEAPGNLLSQGNQDATQAQAEAQAATDSGAGLATAETQTQLPSEQAPVADSRLPEVAAAAADNRAEAGALISGNAAKDSNTATDVISSAGNDSGPSANAAAIVALTPASSTNSSQSGASTQSAASSAQVASHVELPSVARAGAQESVETLTEAQVNDQSVQVLESPATTPASETGDTLNAFFESLASANDPGVGRNNGNNGNQGRGSSDTVQLAGLSQPDNQLIAGTEGASDSRSQGRGTGTGNPVPGGAETSVERGNNDRTRSQAAGAGESASNALAANQSNDPSTSNRDRTSSASSNSAASAGNSGNAFGRGNGNSNNSNGSSNGNAFGRGNSDNSNGAGNGNQPALASSNDPANGNSVSSNGASSNNPPTIASGNGPANSSSNGNAFGRGNGNGNQPTLASSNGPANGSSNGNAFGRGNGNSNSSTGNGAGNLLAQSSVQESGNPIPTPANDESSVSGIPAQAEPTQIAATNQSAEVVPVATQSLQETNTELAVSGPETAPANETQLPVSPGATLAESSPANSQPAPVADATIEIASSSGPAAPSASIPAGSTGGSETATSGDSNWGLWNRPVEENFDVTPIEQPVNDNADADVMPTQLASMSGKYTYSSTAGFDGAGNAGDVTNVDASFRVNFDNGKISSGSLVVDVGNAQTWDVSFNGEISGNGVSLDPSRGRLSDLTGVISRSVDANLNGMFMGNEAEAFHGGFDLLDQANQLNQVNGSYVLER